MTIHVFTVGLERATCCLRNMLQARKKYCNEHALNKKCKESQCSREQWANGKTSVPPSYVQQEHFFFSLHKTLVIYLFYSVWANSWEKKKKKKAVLEEMGFVPRENVAGASGLGSAAPAGPRPHSRTRAGTEPGDSKGSSSPAQLAFALFART